MKGPSLPERDGIRPNGRCLFLLFGRKGKGEVFDVAQGIEAIGH